LQFDDRQLAHYFLIHAGGLMNYPQKSLPLVNGQIGRQSREQLANRRYQRPAYGSR
ncbi:hypothetical protein H6G60_20005, partial [Coleofasciculus sp. FACHB-SPT36]|nr:hypothetical protein [Coleofasciculus sp. FACHB-SPT36]